MPNNEALPNGLVEDECPELLAGYEDFVVVDNFQPAGEQELADFENFASDDENVVHMGHRPERAFRQAHRARRDEAPRARHLPPDFDPNHHTYTLLNARDEHHRQRHNRHGRVVNNQPTYVVQWIDTRRTVFSDEERAEFRRRQRERTQRHPDSPQGRYGPRYRGAIIAEQTAVAAATEVEQVSNEEEILVPNDNESYISSSSDVQEEQQTEELAPIEDASRVDTSEEPSDVSPHVPEESTIDESSNSLEKDETQNVREGRNETDQVEVIKNLMSNFKLPEGNIPEWANEVSEENWKQVLLEKLNKPPT